jgi:hypothetical protein
VEAWKCYFVWNCDKKQDQKVAYFWKSKQNLCRNCTRTYRNSHSTMFGKIDSSSSPLFSFTRAIPACGNHSNMIDSTVDSSSRPLVDSFHEPFRLEQELVLLGINIAESTVMKMNILTCHIANGILHSLFAHVLRISSSLCAMCFPFCAMCFPFRALDDYPFGDDHSCFVITFQSQILSRQWFLTGLWNVMMNRP